MSVTHTNPVNGHRPPRKQALLATGFLLTFSVEGEANKAVLMGSGLVIIFFAFVGKKASPWHECLMGMRLGDVHSRSAGQKNHCLCAFPGKSHSFIPSLPPYRVWDKSQWGSLSVWMVSVTTFNFCQLLLPEKFKVWREWIWTAGNKLILKFKQTNKNQHWRQRITASLSLKNKITSQDIVRVGKIQQRRLIHPASKSYGGAALPAEPQIRCNQSSFAAGILALPEDTEIPEWWTAKKRSWQWY